MVERKAALLDMDVSFPQHCLRLETLARARDVDPDKYHIGLGCQEMAVCGPGEDVITLAANAAWRLLQRHPHIRDQIGLCIVGTESGVDCAKPISIHLHNLLELPSNCRVFEIKHACYGATAGLQMAQAWISQRPHRYALVVAADIARYERLSAGEPTQGAGAVAMLLGMARPEDACLTLSPVSGTHAKEVYDFWRPMYQSAALVKGKYSVNCYLDSLVAAYDDYCSQVSAPPDAAHMLYHVPFPNMARKAHLRLMQHCEWKADDAILQDYHQRVEPSLWANRRIGNVYSASLYLALAGLLERQTDAPDGAAVTLFSYGSGSCGEFFVGELGGQRPPLQLEAMLNLRSELDIDGYESLNRRALAMERDGTFVSQLASPNPLRPFTYQGIRDHERVYRKEPQPFSPPVVRPHVAAALATGAVEQRP